MKNELEDVALNQATLRGELVTSLLPKCVPLRTFKFDAERQFDGGKSTQVPLRERIERRSDGRTREKDMGARTGSNCRLGGLDEIYFD